MGQRGCAGVNRGGFGWRFACAGLVGQARMAAVDDVVIAAVAVVGHLRCMLTGLVRSPDLVGETAVPSTTKVELVVAWPCALSEWLLQQAGQAVIPAGGSGPDRGVGHGALVMTMETITAVTVMIQMRMEQP